MKASEHLLHLTMIGIYACFSPLEVLACAPGYQGDCDNLEQKGVGVRKVIESDVHCFNRPSFAAFDELMGVERFVSRGIVQSTPLSVRDLESVAKRRAHIVELIMKELSSGYEAQDPIRLCARVTIEEGEIESLQIDFASSPTVLLPVLIEEEGLRITGHYTGRLEVANVGGVLKATEGTEYLVAGNVFMVEYSMFFRIEDEQNGRAHVVRGGADGFTWQATDSIPHITVQRDYHGAREPKEE